LTQTAGSLAVISIGLSILHENVFKIACIKYVQIVFQLQTTLIC